MFMYVCTHCNHVVLVNGGNISAGGTGSHSSRKLYMTRQRPVTFWPKMHLFGERPSDETEEGSVAFILIQMTISLLKRI